MTLNVTFDVRTADGTTPMQRTRSLPTLPDSQPWKPPFFDRIGGVVSGDKPLLAGGSIAGSILGAVLTHGAGGGIFASLLGGVGGALVGAAFSMGIGIFTHRNDNAQPTQPDNQVAPSTTIRGTEHVKVMTYNLHGGMGSSGKIHTSSQKLDQLAETIRREHPDVVIFQESDTGALRSDLTDTMAELSRRLDPVSAVEASPGTYGTGRRQYSGVMTFNGFQVDNARDIVHDNPTGDGFGRRIMGSLDTFRKIVNEVLNTDIQIGSGTASYSPRASIDTIVRTPGGNDIRVAGGHYNGPSGGYNFPKFESIPMAEALGAWHGATLFGGDFNVPSNSKTGLRIAAAFKDSGLTDAFTAVGIKPGDAKRHFSSRAGGDIDRIYVSDAFHVNDMHVVSESGDTASDHDPVVADLTLSGGE